MPETEVDGLPAFDRGDEYIYGRYLLLRSFLALSGRRALVAPRDTEALIESVYHPAGSLPGAGLEPFCSALHEAKQEEAERKRKAESKAQSTLVAMPDDVGFLDQSSAGLEENNPDLLRYRRATTRLAPPSVTLICLHRSPDGSLALDPEPGSQIVDLEQKPDWPTTRELVNRQVRVSNYELVEYLLSQKAHKSWRDSAWLRSARLVIFKGGEGECQDASFVLKLDRTFGLYLEDRQ